MDKLISIVVPVYNVEKYVERCLRSIMAQTYKNIEIIVVDDGATDESSVICDRLALEDERIRLFHNKNGGVSYARNFGVENAKGEYITFIDSDDFIAENYIEHLLDIKEKYNADIACCNYVDTYDDSTDYTPVSEAIVTMYDKHQICYRLVSAGTAEPTVVWGKLFNAETLRNNPSTIGRRSEDVEVMPRWLYSADCVAVSDCRLYAYYQSDSGYMNSTKGKKNDDAIWAQMARAQFFETNNEAEIAKCAWQRYAQYLIDTTFKTGDSCEVELKELLGSKRKYLSNQYIGKIFLCIYGMPLYKVYRKIRWH